MLHSPSLNHHFLLQVTALRPPTSDSIDALTTQVSKILQTLHSRSALPSSSTATLANLVDITCATLKPPSWILDSGTSSHMFVN